MSLVDYLKSSYNEFVNKVEWPKWPELQSSTIVVAVATVLLALFTFLVDYLFGNAVKNSIAMLINTFN